MASKRIWTLCGSAKFEKDFHDWNRYLSFCGDIVLSLVAFPSIMGDKNWYTPQQKAVLDIIHFKKIYASTHVMILNRDNYIGESTMRELLYALLVEKEVFSIMPMSMYAAGQGHPLTSLASDAPDAIWPVTSHRVEEFLKAIALSGREG